MSGTILTSLLVAKPDTYIAENTSLAEEANEEDLDNEFDDEYWEDFEEDEETESENGDFEMPKLFETYHIDAHDFDSLVASNTLRIGRDNPMFYYDESQKEEKEEDNSPKFTWEDAVKGSSAVSGSTIGYDTNASSANKEEVLKEISTKDISEKFKNYGVYPVDSEVYGVSSEYGPRINPIGKKEKVFHTGLDVWSANIESKNIYSVLPGVVSFIGDNPEGYGHHVIVDHDGFKTLYGHMETVPAVKVGTEVKAGTVIGKIGSTGRSTGPHLHLEVDVDGVKINPKPFMSVVGKPGDKNTPKKEYVQAERDASTEIDDEGNDI